MDRIKKYFKQDLRTHGGDTELEYLSNKCWMNCLGYAINFFLCEILALFNIVGMIYFTDRFLGYQFTTVRKSLGQD